MPTLPRSLAVPAYRAFVEMGGLAGRAARAWRLAARDPRERDLAERLALPGAIAPLGRGGAWLHAASVGEVRALAPLARALREADPALSLRVTTSTTSGRERAREELGLPCTLAPWDAAGPLTRFLDAVAPSLHVVIETELWPGRLAALARRRVPAALVSARIGTGRVATYRRLRALYEPALASLALVAPASEADRRRLLALGARESSLAPIGNLKWDAAPTPSAGDGSAALRAELGLEHAVAWVLLGSAHPGEAGPLARSLGDALRPGGPLGLLVAPRHPRRFDALARELAEAGHPAHRATDGPAPAGTRVLLVDRLGVLPGLYPLAAVALVGGTFVPVGGHGPLEAAAAACPMIAGPHTDAQEDLVAPLVAAGALRTARDADAAAAIVREWLDDEGARRGAGAAGRAELARRRGVARALAPRLLELAR